jgi:hypothetical protein
VFTVIRRLFLGAPVTMGDRQHSYDLAAASLGRPWSTVAFLAVGVLASVLAVALSRSPTALWVVGLGGGAAALLASWWLLRSRRPPVIGEPDPASHARGNEA